MSKKCFVVCPISDNGIVSLLVDRLSNSQAKTDDQVLMETLLPKLLDNPDSLKTLIQLGNEFPSVPKKTK